MVSSEALAYVMCYESFRQLLEAKVVFVGYGNLT